MEELEKLREEKEKILNYIKNIEISDVKSKEISIRIGNEIIVFSQSGRYNLSIEDEIREELKVEVNKKLQSIGERLNERIQSASEMISTYKNQYEMKKHEVEEKLKNASIMPDINFNHASRGLSVVKGGRAGEYIWLMNGIFNPKYIDDRMIEKKYRSMMLTQVVFVISTRDNKITNIEIRKPIGLGDFRHYHTNCWGDFKYSREWSTPDDIISLAKEAEIVLETINSMSLADRSPDGLPRFQTVKKHLLNKGDSDGEMVASKHLTRAGVTETIRNNEEEIWGR
jgi:hypothetical protein